ncbi:amine oxidase B [Dactylonectria macrodidyma]|uniref:Amine oxidase n=1 Tax=Dactylonectria macrodidyma TaxID=307937 RepID=A0A9P9FTV6_9HYPO|nr:amine oxidase B [Dactylonectria macrodidyma]
MFDVIVVGAGLSGLQAAYSAQQAGLSVVVVEARNRVGGKTWSVPLASGRGYADLGAAWINDTTQKRISAYATQFKSKVVKQRLVGNAVMLESDGNRIVYPFGITPEFSAEDKKNMEYIRDHIQAASLTPGPARVEDDNVSIDQYVRNLGAGPKTIKMINIWVKVMHGLESTEESAAWFIDYCRRNGGLFSIRADDHTGGNYLRFHDGAQSIATGIAELIGHSNIHLSEPVASIENHKTHTTVTTTNGKKYTGKKCIVSVPSAMYKSLNFSPVLPAPVRDITDSSKLGHYNKSILCYDTPWWRDLGYNGFVMCNEGPITLTRDTSVDEKRMYSITCFVNGKAGEEWGNLYPHERRSTVLNQLAKAFNVGPDSELFRPIEIFEQIWKHEPYSQGALAPVTALGHYTKYASVYGKPIGNLHFVGTEYSMEWKGYMEGALCSGEKGAQEVVDALQKSLRANL